MSDEATKKRLARSKKRISAALAIAGFKIYSFSDGPFHLCADSDDASKRILICFGPPTPVEKRRVMAAPVPQDCYREIWQLSEDGRRFEIAFMEKDRKKKYLSSP